MKKVSVIVPCYNQSEYLSETLDSVFLQTFKNWECIIVNDGSSDNTEKIALEYCKKDERFKYFYQNNQGVSVARNKGIKESCGYYILPLDGDDIIDATYMEKAVKYFENNPKTTLVYCNADFFGIENGPWQLPEYKYESFIWDNCIFVSALYKREDFDKTSGYNVNMREGLEDWDFWLSLLDKDSVIYRIDEVLFHYRIKEKSRNTEATNHLKFLYRQLYYNHEEIYAPYLINIIAIVRDVISFRNENEKLKSRLNVERDNLMILQSSYSYRIGRFLLYPFRLFKRLLK